MTDLIANGAEYWHSISPYMPGFWKGSLTVVQVTILSVLVSWVVGLIAAIGKSSKNKLIRSPFAFYVWFIRGTPALIQIFIVFFGLPQLGIRFSPFTAGVIALGLNSGAYVAENFRAGFSAIPKGQLESALALGMKWSLAFRRVILPQVIRIIIPTLTNQAIFDLKTTSLLSTITIMELTLHTQIIIASTFRPFEFYIICALCYLFMTTILSQISVRFEKRKALAYER